MEPIGAAWGGTWWSIAIVVGPILLAAVLLWAVIANKRRSNADRDRSERGAKELRDQLHREQRDNRP